MQECSREDEWRCTRQRQASDEVRVNDTQFLTACGVNKPSSFNIDLRRMGRIGNSLLHFPRYCSSRNLALKTSVYHKVVADSSAHAAREGLHAVRYQQGWILKDYTRQPCPPKINWDRFETTGR